jgi:hypothetical protein
MNALFYTFSDLISQGQALCRALMMCLVSGWSPLSRKRACHTHRRRWDFQDQIQKVRDYQDGHFRLYIDCDDLVMREDDFTEESWREAWQSNSHITRVTITISGPTSQSSNSSADVMSSTLNQLLQGIALLPNLKEICLSDIFDDDEVYIFPLSLVTSWLQQAPKLEQLTFYMAHISIAAAVASIPQQNKEDVVAHFATALQSHPSLTTLELDHCTFHQPSLDTRTQNNKRPIMSSDDQIYQAFVQSSQTNWNLTRIANNSSCLRRHPLQDTIDMNCTLNRQRSEWYKTLYSNSEEYSIRLGSDDMKEANVVGLDQLHKLSNDLDSTYYYLSTVNPNLLMNIQCSR